MICLDNKRRIHVGATARNKSNGSGATMVVIKRVSIIGSGYMGSGIGMASSRGGYLVTLMDIHADALTKALRRIRARLQEVYVDEEDKIQEVLQRIRTTTSLEEAVKDADLVIEAVTEKLGIKQQLFKLLDTLSSSNTILASNTSSLTITEIAAEVSERRKTQCGGLHFFNPISLTDIVEVVPIAETSNETLDLLMSYVKGIGKKILKCKDTPGFIVNRVFVAYTGQTFQMLERGDATIEDINTAATFVRKMPEGAFARWDNIGLDVVLCVLENLHERLPEGDIYKPTTFLRELVAQGKLGRKTGEGFYKYDVSEDGDVPAMI
ncbi:unnamed protein product [Cyprideis torosa]|uniref:3-hydroxyacyl-CoA dehydrogenase n=1 Tax=Cyprideis torosa TaxID=163714 RepID=A0A7R8WW91_9CRUS|nr:unnamed protein product [Cyprideis torosa]CAG0908232.1 unnamed protein product [Cyprideis torosa]